MRPLFLVYVLFACVACRSAPPVEDVLTEQHATRGGAQEALRGADEEVRVAQALVESEPGWVHHQVAAARALMVAADLRLLIDTVERAKPAEGVDELVASDDAAGSELKSAVQGLCTAGLEHARAAVEIDPYLVEASYYEAFHLALLAWSEGTATALMRGRGPVLAQLTEELASKAPELHGAGNLRLRGRFLDSAPWPYGDRERAIMVLRMSVAQAQTAVNYQFLGDALWRSGDQPGAVQAWEAGSRAAPVPATEYGASLRRALNQARLDALASE